MSTQTDPNIDPAERHEHFWPTPTLEHRTGEHRRGSDSELAQRLAATEAHELELLEQVSTAHSDGYGSAVEQLRSLLDLAVTDAPSHDLAGLASALRLLELLRPATHRVALVDVGGMVTPRLECTAGAGAHCRVTCTGSLAGRCVDVCECDEPSLVDGDVCQAAAWLNDCDPIEFLSRRVGRPDRELNSAPVAVRWTHELAAWQWCYVVDLPEGVTPDGWGRTRADS